jgi:hypothetical protein
MRRYKILIAIAILLRFVVYFLGSRQSVITPAAGA